MKKLLIGIIGICLVAGLAIAADPMLAGKTFQATINDDLYTLEFVQGPFGPGEMGTATLSGPGITDMPFDYQFQDPFCMIESARFVLVYGNLIYVPADSLTFTEQE